MKLIEKLSEYIEEEIEDANKYVDCALKWKEDNPMLAKSFYDLSVQELNHMSILHEEVVKAINDYKQAMVIPQRKCNLFTIIFTKGILKTLIMLG